MNGLPVVFREMRLAARKRWLYRTRTAVAFAGIGVWIFIFITAPPRMSGAERGMVLLVALSVLAMLVALLSGVFLTSDCLSEEKREGTLGLLFLTPLKGYDVVLGKMAANAGVAFLSLLAIVPTLCLPLITGGVSWTETGRVVLVLLLSLALSLALGIFVSARHTDSRKAFVMTLLSVISICGIPLVVWLVMETLRWNKSGGGLFFELSPIYTLILAFDRNYNRSTSAIYWESVAILALLAITLIAVTCRKIRMSWSDSKAERQESARERKGRPGKTVVHARLPLVVHRAGDLYAWLCYRGSALGLGTILFVGFGAAFWACMLALSGTNQVRQQGFMIAMATAFMLHLIFKSIFALEATRQIHHDVRSGSMELLLATPIREREILQGHAEACRRRFLIPITFLAGLNLIMELSIFVLYDHLHMREVAKVFTVFFMGGLVLLYADFHAIRWVGAWSALRSQSHLKATFDTLKKVLVIPWLLFPAFFFTAVRQPGGGRRVENVMLALMLVWFLCGLGIDLYLIWKTKRRLSTSFRALASGESS